MRLKFSLRKILTVIATLATLANSFAAPSIALAQELSTPAPVDTSTPAPTVAPTENPTTTPDATPAETATPTPEATATPTDQPTVAPTETPTVTQAPESNPTTTAPPADSNSSPTAQPTLSATPTASPEPQDNPSIASTVLTTNVFPQTIQDNSWFKLITDKLDYSPTEIVQISGSGFIPDKDYTLEIVSTDTPPVDFTTQVKADGSGNINYSYQLDGNYRPNYTVYIKDGEVVVATVTFTDAKETSGNISVNFDQCANNDHPTPAGQCNWIGSILQKTNSSYFEGMSVPQRILYQGINTSGNHTITFSYSYTKGGTHAYDFLTSLNQGNSSFSPGITNLDKCDGLTGGDATACNSLISSSPSYATIPFDPFDSKDSAPGLGTGTTQTQKETWYEGIFGSRQFTIYSSVALTPGSITLNHDVPADGDTTDSNVNISFSFSLPSSCTTTACNVLIFFGGHLAVTGSNNTIGDDWGTPLGSSNINGGPYHIKTLKLDGNGGSLDNQIAGADIILPGTIIINKSAVGSDKTFNYTSTGGSTIPSAFTITTTSGSGSTTFNNVLAGSYSVTEGSQADPWAFTSLQCTDPTNNTTVNSQTANINVAAGETVTCTYTNTYTNPSGTLIVKKLVINDNGGTSTPNDFTFKVGDGTATPFTEIDSTHGENDLTVNAGSYSVTEPAVSGYTTTYDNCSNVTVPSGGSATCTITNNDQPGTLIVKKLVINNNGGSSTPSDFTFQVGNETAVPFTEIDSTHGENHLSVNAGPYTITEPAVSGYTTTYSNCTDVIVANGGSATCTITNDDQQAYITVTKVVNNKHGGKANPDDFKLTLDGSAVLSGTKMQVNPGPHTVAETLLPGYSFDGFSGDCTTASLSVALGESKTCTLTNSDQQAYITVVKNVIKDNGGTANPDDFKLTLEGNAVLSGVAVPVDPGTYTAAETQLPGYSFTGFSDNCDSNGDITVALGESKTCTLTNDDIAPSLTLVKNVANNYGGNEPATAWTLYASSGPTPISGAGGVVSDGTFKAGTYTLSESTGPSGYIPGNWSCIGDATNTGNSITLSLGQNATCSITNSDVPASITVDKITNPSGASDLFTFNLSGTITGSAVLADATAPYTFSGLSVGTYSLTEEDISGWDLTNVSCTLNRQTSTNLGVSLGLGDSLNCTFTNTQKGHLIVEKTTDPANDPTVFDITASGTGTITGGGAGTVSDTKDQDYEVTPGTYSVSESLLGSSDWNNTGNTCTDVVVGAGETKSCQLTNQKKGTIVIKKVMIGGTDTFSFSGNVSGTISANNGTIISGGKTPKNGFTSTESPKAGWELTSISCDDNNSTGDVRTRTATFNVDPGETVTCTFTNTKYGYMQGRKYIDANMDGRLENGESFLDNWTVRLYNSTWQPLGAYTTGTGGLLTGQYKFGNLLPGIYNTCEVQQTGYQQTGPLLGAHAVDYNGNQVNGSTAVANGSGQTDEAPICWQSTINGNGMEWLGFGNIQLGKIIVEKETNTDTEDRFTFSSNYSKNFTLGNGGSYDSGYLLPGDYSVSERTSNNWQLGSATCDNEDSPSNIHLGAGDIVTCRFVNNELVPGVSITKSNDSGSGITAGATVTYTLNVKNTGSIDFNNVYVYDYLPGGFTYVSGSVSGADFISLVGSKLTLNLASLDAGAIATITYKVSTNSALANGTYTNYATCQATYFEESTLPCDPANSNVTIGNGIGYGGNMQGQVLGASTELPATGSPTELLFISLAILGLGIFLNGYTMRKQKKALKKASKKKASKKKSKRHAKK